MVLEEVFDFTENGAEIKRWRTPDGDELHFRATYFDIVPEQRIVYGYEMSFRGERLSVSLVTVELRASGSKTDVTVTEQAVFFGRGMQEQRVAGTEGGYDRLVEVANGAVLNA